MKVLVTGIAGFIGMHVAQKMLAEGHEVVGIDNLNGYYDPKLKESRLKKLGLSITNIEHGQHIRHASHPFSFSCCDLKDYNLLDELFVQNKFDAVVHLAAQPGVRYSLENPNAYIDSNIQGFMNMLELCRHHAIKHLVFASSSSVYGLNSQIPFKTNQHTDHPISLYGATKKANEVMAHTYAHLFGIPCTGLRFFTVYGPYGRPDMAIFKFTENILQGKPIDVYNNGDMQRDFTYVDDISESIVRITHKIPAPDLGFDTNHPNPSKSSAPFKLFNIGNDQPVILNDFIHEIELATGKKAILNHKPIQSGDVLSTHADITELAEYIDFRPNTSIHTGVQRFVDWYKMYYNIQ